jgi:copper(I)-binding protein
MFMGLAAQVKEGDQVPVTLTVQDDKGARQSIEVQAPARALTAQDHSHSGH